MSYEPPSAPDTFTGIIRRAQHETLVREIKKFFSELAKDEPMWPHVPDEELFPALGQAIIDYASGPDHLDRIIAQLQVARAIKTN